MIAAMNSDSLLLLHPADKDIGGGFKVRRLLPAAKRRSVGPFVFFDHFGPATEQPGNAHDVRPHPHIGLATVTYLFDGAMMHRDSIGSVQEILPGAINWMTAGRGIVHSERKPERLLEANYVNQGLQLWAALPQAFEETDPSFEHTAASDIPETVVKGVPVRVLIGTAFGLTSPVKTFAPTLYLDIALPAGEWFELPALAQEMAIYVVEGDLMLDGAPVPEYTMAALADNTGATLEAQTAVRLVVIGGDALDGPRFITWNFVSSRRDRILEAGADWKGQRMGQVPGDTAFIPLPGHPFGVQELSAKSTPV